MGDVIHAESRFDRWWSNPTLTIDDLREAFDLIRRPIKPLTEEERRQLIEYCGR